MHSLESKWAQFSCLNPYSRGVGIDENLYELKGRNMTDLVELAQTHVDSVNSIYKQVYALFILEKDQ